MNGRHDLAAQMAVLKVLLQQLSDAKKAADCEIRDGWTPGDRNSAKLSDGTVVASVTLANGRTNANVTDQPTYMGWVRKTHPDQIEEVKTVRVRPEFTDRLLSAAKKLGVAVDAETGEQVPGITVSSGDPHPMVKLADDAPALVAAAWQKGQLAELMGALLAIESDVEDTP
jgi:hypothetical protein